jgi:guanine deaminase
VNDAAHLEDAVRLAVRAAHGVHGPFGALVVAADGSVVGEGTNQVTSGCDPTAHAEVVALRAATTARQRFDLRGHVLYASCYPCPMCLTAAWWARVDRVVYAAVADDAAAAGFDDRRFWDAMTGGGEPAPIVPLVHVPLASATDPFRAWAANPDKVEY